MQRNDLVAWAGSMAPPPAAGENGEGLFGNGGGRLASNSSQRCCGSPEKWPHA